MLGNLCRNTLGEPWPEHPEGTGPTTGYKSKTSQNKTKHNTRSLKLNVTSWFLYS